MRLGHDDPAALRAALVGVLAGHEVFRRLTADGRAQLAQRATLHHGPQGATLWRAGEGVTGFCVLLGGAAMVVADGGAFSSLVELGVERAPVGLLESLGGHAHVTTASVLSERASWAMLPLDVATQAFVDCPAACVSLASTIAAGVHHRHRRMRAAREPVDRRVAAVLVELSSRFGAPATEGQTSVTIPIALPRKVVARMTGTSPETVIRALGRMQRRRLVRFGDHHTEILRSDLMRNLASPTE